MMKHKILFCGNGMSGEAIEWLSKEYEIAIITEFINDKGINCADKVVQANSKNKLEALAAAKKIWNSGFKFKAVLSLCWDCPESVSLIAYTFGLRGVPLKIAESSSNKFVRAKILGENGIRVPKCFKVKTIEEIIKKKLKLPLIIKPNRMSSARGVIRVDDMDKIKSSYEYVKMFSEDIVINEMIEGVEYSAEGLMIEGHIYLTGISERIFKYKEYYPNFVEAGDILPANLNLNEQASIKKIVELASVSLGILNGVVKADIIKAKNGKVYILELTPRLGGPRFGTEIIPLYNGTNILKAYIQQLLGEKIELNLLFPKYSRGVANLSIFSRPGIIKNVTINSIKDMPGFYDFKWWNISEPKEGDEIIRPEYGCGNLGYIIATGFSREDAMNNAKNIEKEIIINYKE